MKANIKPILKFDVRICEMLHFHLSSSLNDTKRFLTSKALSTKKIINIQRLTELKPVFKNLFEGL